MKVDIGVIGAMEPEILDLLSTMTDRTDETVSGVTFHTGIIDGKRVVLAKCGIGKVFAAISAQTMIMKYSPSLLVNTGVGGGIACGISTGDVVIADKLCQHDMDTSAIGDPKGLVSGINMIYFESDKRAVEILKACADSIGIKATVGTVASGDKFIASYEDKKEIYDNFGASACEMEGCAIAQVAFVNSTPFAVVRAISDSADGEATMDYPTFLPIAAKNSAALTRALISKW
jgi:adenosylhomocysteine nucleosidase